MAVTPKLKSATLFLAAWLGTAPILLFIFSAPADVPYYGVLRGWENGDVNSIAGYDIAVDDSGIYIAGEFFKAPGYGPTILFLNPDHSFRCQRLLDIRRVDNRWVPRVPAAGYSIALNETHVIVAGVYTESPARWLIARLFIAVFDKNYPCDLISVREFVDPDFDWVGLYHSFWGGGIKALWDDATDSIYVILSTWETVSLNNDHLYLLHLDSGLNILSDSVRYDDLSPGIAFVSDMS